MADPPIPARYQILLEILQQGPLRASDLTDPTGLTLQGVSYHLKQLKADGLVSLEGEDRRARLTQEGIEALHEHFQGLKAFVDLALSEMLRYEECVALAGEALVEGDEVGLFMEDGRLVARRERSPSTGNVRRGGQPGDPVVVTGLTGVVDIQPGTVHVLQLPRPDRLAQADEVGAFVEDEALAWDLLALSGVEAEVLAEGAGLADRAEVVRFAPGHAARNAAQVGLDVLLIASWETATTLVETIREAAGTTSGSVEVVVHEM